LICTQDILLFFFLAFLMWIYLNMFQIRLMKDKDTGESKGFAFVAFKSKEVARKATEELRSKDYKVVIIGCSNSLA